MKKMINTIMSFVGIPLLRPPSARASLDTRLEDIDFVVLDTELTGLNVSKDSIVSVGALRMKGGSIDVGKGFYRLVSPKTPISRQSVLVHGITPSEALVQKGIDQLLPELVQFIGDAVIVGHFISLDMSFINRELCGSMGHGLENPVIDTARIYEWIRKCTVNGCAYHESGVEDLSLGTLARKYSIDCCGMHNALQDAYVTAQLLQRFIRKYLPAAGMSTLGDLLKAGAPKASRAH